jgi:hypothetical protein
MIDSATLSVVQQTIDRLDQTDVAYRVEAGKLLVRPLDRLSAVVRESLRQLKPELIEYLSGRRVDDYVVGDIPLPDDLDLIEPDEVPVCPQCGLMEMWQSVLGNWRCERCDPPSIKWTADELLKLRNKLLGRIA